MYLIHTERLDGEFDLVTATAELQAAMMTLRHGAASDDEPSNEHPHSEQWLFVLSGSGTATVIPERGRKRMVKLRAGSMLVIEKGELHQIKSPKQGELRAISFYAPPAYKRDGTVRRAAKP